MLRLSKKPLPVSLAPVGYGIWEILHIVCCCKQSHKIKAGILSSQCLEQYQKYCLYEWDQSNGKFHVGNESMYRDFVWTVRYFEKFFPVLRTNFFEGLLVFKVLWRVIFIVYKFFFAPLKSPCIKYWSLFFGCFQNISYLLVCTLGTPVFRESIVEKLKSLIHG